MTPGSWIMGQIDGGHAAFTQLVFNAIATGERFFQVVCVIQHRPKMNAGVPCGEGQRKKPGY
jgi:hypothetical protein